jgi:ADP-dependent NAD(P)H-hydrate dehydratase
LLPADAPRDVRVVTTQQLRSWAPKEPDDGGDKHSRGTVAVVGGGTSTPGAVLLAGLAALRVGAGRLQVVTVDTTSVALAVSVPEAMVSGLPADEHGSISPDATDQLVETLGGAGTVVLGPGLSGDGVPALLRGLLPRLGDDVTLVLDAVGLTALAKVPELLGPLAARTVLTPNSGELAALLNGEQLEEREACTAVVGKYGAVVSGRGWVVGPDGRTWREEAGGIGLGTSGSGDVLAGLVGGMLARGAEPAQAAVWGQYLHAAAGDRLSAKLGRMGFLARELLDEVPRVLTTLRP